MWNGALAASLLLIQTDPDLVGFLHRRVLGSLTVEFSYYAAVQPEMGDSTFTNCMFPEKSAESAFTSAGQ